MNKIHWGVTASGVYWRTDGQTNRQPQNIMPLAPFGGRGIIKLIQWLHLVRNKFWCPLSIPMHCTISSHIASREEIKPYNIASREEIKPYKSLHSYTSGSCCGKVSGIKAFQNDLHSSFPIKCVLVWTCFKIHFLGHFKTPCNKNTSLKFILTEFRKP